MLLSSSNLEGLSINQVKSRLPRNFLGSFFRIFNIENTMYFYILETNWRQKLKFVQSEYRKTDIEKYFEKLGVKVTVSRVLTTD